MWFVQTINNVIEESPQSLTGRGNERRGDEEQTMTRLNSSARDEEQTMTRLNSIVAMSDIRTKKNCITLRND